MLKVFLLVNFDKGGVKSKTIEHEGIGARFKLKTLVNYGMILIISVIYGLKVAHFDEKHMISSGTCFIYRKIAVKCAVYLFWDAIAKPD